MTSVLKRFLAFSVVFASVFALAIASENTPRYAYRGLMIDCSRHFWPKEFLMKQMDAMAMLQMNKLHLHLTDAGGWRLEIKAFPRLTSHAAWRTQEDWMQWWVRGDRRYCTAEDKGAYGGFYTQGDIKEIVAYAEKLGIDYIGYYEDLGKHEWRSDHALTSVVCNWDRYYEDIIRRYLKGELNYVDKQWVGMEADFVELCDFSPAVTDEEKAKLIYLKERMLAGHFVFAGEIYDRQGQLRCRADESIRDDRLLQHMDWLVKGVEILE